MRSLENILIQINAKLPWTQCDHLYLLDEVGWIRLWYLSLTSLRSKNFVQLSIIKCPCRETFYVINQSLVSFIGCWLGWEGVLWIIVRWIPNGKYTSPELITIFLGTGLGRRPSSNPGSSEGYRFKFHIELGIFLNIRGVIHLEQQKRTLQKILDSEPSLNNLNFSSTVIQHFYIVLGEFS